MLDMFVQEKMQYVIKKILDSYNLTMFLFTFLLLL